MEGDEGQGLLRRLLPDLALDTCVRRKTAACYAAHGGGSPWEHQAPVEASEWDMHSRVSHAENWPRARSSMNCSGSNKGQVTMTKLPAKVTQCHY